MRMSTSVGVEGLLSVWLESFPPSASPSDLHAHLHKLMHVSVESIFSLAAGLPPLASHNPSIFNLVRGRDGQMEKKRHTLFSYVFIKGCIFWADPVFRSVSHVIYCPATPEGWGTGGSVVQTAERARVPLTSVMRQSAASTWTHHQSKVPHPSQASFIDDLLHFDSSVDLIQL